MLLTPEILLKAYAIGVFPMAEGRHYSELHWIDPDQRGILPLEGLHVSRKLKKRLRRGEFEIRCDCDFGGVIEGCAESRPERPDTWINGTIRSLYGGLYDAGFAHSVECWKDGALVGGLYGVSMGAAFFGESMFSRATDASKVALVHLVARLRKGGYQLLDTQFVTPHLQRFGALEIPRADYQRRLSAALAQESFFPKEISQEDLDSLLGEKSRPAPGPTLDVRPKI